MTVKGSCRGAERHKRLLWNDNRGIHPTDKSPTKIRVSRSDTTKLMRPQLMD